MSLGDERLSTTDSKGNRIFLHPAEVKGFFRKYRTLTQAVLICLFLIVPWLKWDGTQLLLFDIAGRTFHILGFIFKAHDAPLIFLILAVGTIALAFVTAIWGRVWCGWACPQTVFIDAIYRRIEYWIQGDYLKRRKLAKQGWDQEKITKIGSTWIAYTIISMLIAHSFVAYFVGSERLIEMMQGSPRENWNAFLIVMSMTLVLLFDFGWFREQFCIIACPYGRIQSVLMDKKSVSVLYDMKRGEPRKSAGVSKEKQGDCVNCNRCVEVCPTGIDIRRGIQMECIGCTACIDACDDIMTKVKKPVGLIRYSSEYEMEKGISLPASKRLLRPRVLAYSAAIISASLLLLFLVGQREPVLVNVLKTKDAPYSKIDENGNSFILNHFKIHLHNQTNNIVRVEVQTQSNDLEFILPQNNILIESNQHTELHFFVRFSILLSKTQSGKFERDLKIKVKLPEKEYEVTKGLVLVGPI